MKVKKVLLTLFLLVICLNIKVSALEYSVNQGISASFVRIGDCFNLSAGKDLSFRAGALFSIKNSVFAFCSIHDYEQKICQRAFKCPGDTLSISAGAGYSHCFQTDYLLFSTGLDFVFPSSCFSIGYCCISAEAGYQKYVASLGTQDVFASASVRVSFAKDITFASVGIGCTVKDGR